MQLSLSCVAGMSKILSRRLLYVFLILFGSVVSIGNLLAGYFGNHPSSIYSGNISDGWCDPSSQGVGSHCFGDFYYPIATSLWDNPWGSNANPNPPLTQFIYKILSYLSDNGHLGLVIYLLTCLSSVAFPFLYTHKKSSGRPLRIVLLFVLTISSAPFLIAFDRGAMVMALFTPIFMLYIYYKNNDVRRMHLLLVLLVLIKPQLALLNMIFIKDQKFRELPKAIFFQAIAMLLSFLLYFKSFPDSIISYAKQVLDYQAYVPWGSLYPSNLSASNVFGLPFHFFEIEGKISFLRIVVTFILMSLLLRHIIIARHRQRDAETFAILVFSTVVLPGVSFSYYSLLLVLCVLVGYFEYEIDGKSSLGYLFESRYFLIVLFITGSTILIPWPVTADDLLGGFFSGYASANLGANWLIGGFVLTLLYISILLSKLKR